MQRLTLASRDLWLKLFGLALLLLCARSLLGDFASFAQTQKLYAMAAANEPDFASCGSSIGPPCNGDYDTAVYTAKEMVTFVKALGPKLKAVNVKHIEMPYSPARVWAAIHHEE